MPERKPNYELEVGDEFLPHEFVVTPEFNQQYLYGAEDYNPRYIEETESVPPMVHPGLLLNQSNPHRSSSYYIPADAAGFHAAEETEFINPGRVGKKFRVTHKVVDKYEKRGKWFWVFDTRMVDEDGVEILRRLIRNHYAPPKLKGR